MNPDTPQTPREELEVRLTALLMGELSEAEGAEIRAQMEGDPELAALHDGLQQAVKLLREASVIQEPAPEPAPAQFSAERRQRLLAHFKSPATPQLKVLPPPSRRDWKWVVPLGIAASLVALIGGTFVIPSNAPETVFALADESSGAAFSAAKSSSWELPFFRSRKRAQATRMLEDLRLLDSSVDQYAIESSSAAVAMKFGDINDYLKSGTKLYNSSGAGIASLGSDRSYWSYKNDTDGRLGGEAAGRKADGEPSGQVLAQLGDIPLPGNAPAPADAAPAAPAAMGFEGKPAKMEMAQNNTKELKFGWQEDGANKAVDAATATATEAAPATDNWFSQAGALRSIPPPAAEPTPSTAVASNGRSAGKTLDVEPIVALGNVPQIVEFEGVVNYGSPIQTTPGEVYSTKPFSTAGKVNLPPALRTPAPADSKTEIAAHSVDLSEPVVPQQLQMLDVGKTGFQRFPVLDPSARTTASKADGKDFGAVEGMITGTTALPALPASGPVAAVTNPEPAGDRPDGLKAAIPGGGGRGFGGFGGGGQGSPASSDAPAGAKPAATAGVFASGGTSGVTASSDPNNFPVVADGLVRGDLAAGDKVAEPRKDSGAIAKGKDTMEDLVRTKTELEESKQVADALKKQVDELSESLAVKDRTIQESKQGFVRNGPLPGTERSADWSGRAAPTSGGTAGGLPALGEVPALGRLFAETPAPAAKPQRPSASPFRGMTTDAVPGQKSDTVSTGTTLDDLGSVATNETALGLKGMNTLQGATAVTGTALSPEAEIKLKRDAQAPSPAGTPLSEEYRYAGVDAKKMAGKVPYFRSRGGEETGNSVLEKEMASKADTLSVQSNSRTRDKVVRGEQPLKEGAKNLYESIDELAFNAPAEGKPRQQAQQPADASVTKGVKGEGAEHLFWGRTADGTAARSFEMFDTDAEMTVGQKAAEEVEKLGKSTDKAAPAKWLSVMRDGTVGPESAATPANPVVGRTSFWNDDETTKLNINTASEGILWDKPAGGRDPASESKPTADFDQGLNKHLDRAGIATTSGTTHELRFTAEADAPSQPPAFGTNGQPTDRFGLPATPSPANSLAGVNIDSRTMRGLTLPGLATTAQPEAAAPSTPPAPPVSPSKPAGGARSNSAASAATREVARRSDYAKRGEEAIAAGQKALREKDYETAVSQFKLAKTIIPNSPAAKGLSVEALDGYTKASDLYAEQKISEGRYTDAKNQLKEVLKDNPGSKRSVTLLSRLETPDYYNKTVDPKFRGKVEQLKQYATDANGYLETGRYDLAQKRTEQILSLDPYNVAAREMQERINLAKNQSAEVATNEARSRNLWKVQDAWKSPVRSFTNTEIANATANDDARSKIHSKLQKMVLPKLEFRDTTVREALDYLRRKSVELDTEEPDPAKKGISFVLKAEAPKSAAAVPDPAATAVPGLEPIPGTPATAAPESVPSFLGTNNPADARITISLSDIPMVEALKYVSSLANTRFKVEPHGVAVVPLATDASVLEVRTFDVSPEVVAQLQKETGNQPVKTDEVTGRIDATEMLKSSGITFPEGAAAVLIASKNQLVIRNTWDNLDTVEAIVEAAKTATSKAEEPPPPPLTPAADAPQKKVEQPAPTPQPEVSTRENAFSTFSLNVADVAFKLAAASLEQGKMPELSTLRTEEFINALDYRDPEPCGGAALAFASERARYPFAQNRDLLRLSVKTAAAGRQPGRALNIVLLLDNSGSMERADRVRIVRESLRVLAGQLQPQDKLSIITFSRTPHLWIDGVAGDKAEEATGRVGEITPQGGTNISSALDLGYETALRHYQAGNINRVVLLTDGAANLGDVNPEALKKKVEANRKQGIALDCFGIGWEGYDDNLLETLSRNGDGRYGFVNTPEQASTEFAGQLAGALQVAASDVKVQVEFNPRRVTTYRQLGYAKHQLKKEEFRDNTVDAAEIGAAESGNALYTVEVNPRGEGDIAAVRVRYKVPGTSDYREQEWTVPYSAPAAPLDQSSPAMRLAGTAGAFAEWLASSPYATDVDPDQLLGLINGVPAVYGADQRPAKLEAMIRQAKNISGR